MAIDVNNSRFLLGARARGVSFRRTLTLGRLGLFVPPPMLRGMFEDHGVQQAGPPDFFDAKKHEFCEGFFRQLGAEEISSLDFSDYEGATHIHVMNVPVPAAWHERFDAVVDGGTMEHVFNFPTAIINAMQMVSMDGRLLLDLPANNCTGHGFYQFSPELFFRLLQPEHGFAVERVCMAEDYPFSRFYEVRDPVEVRARVTLVNRAPVHVFVQARKVGMVQPFTSFPAQADYTQYWATKTNPTEGPRPAGAAGWKGRLRALAQRFAPRAYWRFSVGRNADRNHRLGRLSNPDFYRPTH